jgi:hypothetical protein
MRGIGALVLWASSIGIITIIPTSVQTTNAQVSVQQAIDYWEQCKGILGYDICKGMIGVGEQVHLLPARSSEGVDYWEQCKSNFGIDSCKEMAAIGEWLGLIRAPS